MGTTQTKVLDRIKEIAKAKKLDADIEYSFSNTGHIYFRSGGLKTCATLQFDFQQGNLSAAFMTGPVKAQYFGEHKKLFYIDFAKSDFEELFKYLTLSIKE